MIISKTCVHWDVLMSRFFFRYIYVLLTNYDLELCDPCALMPGVNASRYGFGMLQPEGDLLVRYRPRQKL